MAKLEMMENMQAPFIATIKNVFRPRPVPSQEVGQRLMVVLPPESFLQTTRGGRRLRLPRAMGC